MDRGVRRLSLSSSVMSLCGPRTRICCRQLAQTTVQRAQARQRASSGGHPRAGVVSTGRHSRNSQHALKSLILPCRAGAPGRLSVHPRGSERAAKRRARDMTSKPKATRVTSPTHSEPRAPAPSVGQLQTHRLRKGAGLALLRFLGPQFDQKILATSMAECNPTKHPSAGLDQYLGILF